MPVQKFKSFEAASRSLWVFNPDADYFKRVAGLFKMFSRLNKFSVTHGVFKFRSLKEAEDHRTSEIKKYFHNV